jgi:hypothetical protein
VGMPWYSAFGNHDALVQGNSPEAYFGPGGLTNPEPPAREVSNPVYEAIATGCLKPATADVGEHIDQLVHQATEDPSQGPALATAAVAYLQGQVATGGALVVPPDARRCHVAKDDPADGAPAPCAADESWIAQHFRTTGAPVGHGFEFRPPQAKANHDGYYSFSPRAGVRFVVLDTVTDECGFVVCSEGSVDDTQYRWLGDELDAAAAAGQYVLVFSHHTLRTTRSPTTDLSEYPIHYGQRVDRTNPGNPQVPVGDSLEDLFCQHPNVLAHVTGHEHNNYVQHYRCEADSPPTPGPGDFWEVSTAAHIDWPQQSRMIELVDDGGSMDMVLTILDQAGAANPGAGTASDDVLRLASIGRELSYNDYQLGKFSNGRGSKGDRNLIVPLDRPFPCGASQGCE